MKSIGDIIKEARNKKKISKDKLEQETKIKKEFIEAIESKRWEKLPEYPVVVGFVKKIATFLSLNEKSAVAVLRRDYPPKDLPINPKPDVRVKFSWGPKFTFIAGVFIVIVLIAGYLTTQYLNFIKPPVLTVDIPTEGQLISQMTIIVKGVTDPDASVIVNNQPALVDEKGSFSAEIEVFGETREIVIISKSRSGKETRVVKKINVLLE